MDQAGGKLILIIATVAVCLGLFFNLMGPSIMTKGGQVNSQITTISTTPLTTP